MNAAAKPRGFLCFKTWDYLPLAACIQCVMRCGCEVSLCVKEILRVITELYRPAGQTVQFHVHPLAALNFYLERCANVYTVYCVCVYTLTHTTSQKY